MSPPLPVYSAEALSALAVPNLIRLMKGDEDRVPRVVIDECARRGEAMVDALEELAGAEDFWKERADLGDWWLRLHAAMVLGLAPSERAGLLLVSFMRRLARAGDDSVQDWLSGYWPALFRNKPQALVAPLRELAHDRSADWYTRIQAVEAALAFGERAGAVALDAALDWAAGISTMASEDGMLRFSIGNQLLDLPRERHRALLEDLAARQPGPTIEFTAADVRRAFAGAQDTPQWRRFEDPWKFYTAEAIARRQERWAKEDAQSAHDADEDSPFDDDESFASDAPYFKAAPKIGRNDPCPCGSGKKYKRCCLAKAQVAPVEELAWRRLRRLLDENRRDMLRFVTNAYGRVAIEEAWQCFISDADAAFDVESPHLTLFMPWFYHRWSPDAQRSRVRDKALHGIVPTAAYLQRKKRLDPLLREYLESCLAAPFSAFEILRADPGRALAMKDLFTGAEHDVSERSASVTMEAGDLVFGQVAQAGGVVLLEASQGFAIPPIWKIKLIDLRQERFADAIVVEPERLRQSEGALLVLYRDIATRLFDRRLPVMQNTDGEPLALRRVVFEVPSAQEAFDALRFLALEQSDVELLRDAVRDPQGGLARVKFSWLEHGNARNPGWDNTVHGSLEIDGSRLTAEVNSEERETRVRAIVAKAFGERARHRATEIQSVEKLLAGTPAGPHSAKESAALAELPEVKAKIAEMMAKHYEHWVNEEIPALGGRTPLEAIADPAGREAVEALVRQIERDGNRMKPPLDPRVAQRLRERLRLR